MIFSGLSIRNIGTRPGAILVVVAVLLSSLMMVNMRAADAAGEGCPVSDTVFLDADGCFRLVPRPTTGTCSAGTTLDPNGSTCREPVALVEETITEEPACPDGFSVNPDLVGICSRVDPAERADPLCPRGARGTQGACYVAAPQYECSEGVLTGDVCSIRLGQPLRGPAVCPESAIVFWDGELCYVNHDLVDGTCPAFTVPGPANTCRQPVDLRPGEQFCDEGGLLDGICQLILPATQLACDAGQQDQFDLCRQPVEDRSGKSFCVGVATELVGDSCIGTSTTSDAVSGIFCADGFTPYSEASATCVRAELADTSPQDCPEGARGIADGCYILLVKNPPSESGCLQGSLIDATCVLAGLPPIYTDQGPVCEATFLPVAGQCLRYTEPMRVPPQCPRNSIELLDGSCRKPVANARGALYCSNPAASLVGPICLTVVPALETQEGLPCPVGFLPADGGGCAISEPSYTTDPACPETVFGSAGACVFLRQPSISGAICAEGDLFGNHCQIIGEPLTIQYVCPVSATVRQDGAECYTTIFGDEHSDGTLVCPAGTSPDPNGLECRRPVDLRPAAGSCEPGFTLAAVCRRFISPEPAAPLCTTVPPDVADNVCWFASSDASGEYYCEDPTALLNESFAAERTCTTTADFSVTCTGIEAINGLCGRPRPACPDGYSPDDALGGLCARTELAVVGDNGQPTCLNPAATLYPFGTPARCAFTTAFVAPCNPAEDACGTRVILVCPLSETVMSDGDGCYRLVGFACPEGSLAQADPTTCRLPVALELLVNFITQTSVGVLGSDGSGDALGVALVDGDFNADGYGDVAMGAPGDSGGRGGVVVLYGSSTGLQEFQGSFVDRTGGTGGSEPGDRYGAALATGDFNGDGVDDLAIGAPGETVLGRAGAGSVTVLYGIRRGTFSSPTVFDGNSASVPGAAEATDELGSALIAGDFNGDGRDDLAVGAPGEALGSKSDAGAVIVFYGSLSGIQLVGSKWLSGDSAGVPGVGEPGDRFGSALAAGDLDANGTVDLAVGVPGEALGSKQEAGAVLIFDGTSQGVASQGAQWISGDSRGTPGVGEPGDRFGAALVAEELNGDNAADLVVGIPGEGLGRKDNAGAVIVFAGSSTGVRTSGAKWLSGDSRGVPGIGESDDRFGASLAVGDFDGSGSTDLVVGVPGEALGSKAQAGAVIVFRGSGAGITATGSLMVHGDSRPVPGVGERGDQFGTAVAIGRFDGVGAGLVVGVPGEDIRTSVDTGAVIELPHRYGF